MPEQGLKCLLGRGFSIAACVGTIIGLGILRTPGEIASTVQDPWLYMGLWAAGGAFVLLSILVSAELISITPRSGGVYALIEKRVSGPYPGFLIGWTDWLAQCSSGALKAVVLMEYLALLIPALAPYVMPGAIVITSFFALLQLAGVRLGGGILQVAATGFAVILVSMSIALLFGEGSALPPESASMIASTATNWAHYGIVVAAIVFTYDGWIIASYFSEEVEGGGRSAAIGSIKGVAIVIMLYLLLNGLLVVNVPLSVLDGSDLALASALDYLYGDGAGSFIIFAALFILLAHQNTQYMAASRGLYALSVDGLGSRRATGVSERGTPSGAVLLCWLMTVTLILVGGFEFLLNMSAVLFIIGYVALMAGVFRLRKKNPDLERPYSAWGFPLTGWICIVGWVAIVIFVGLMDLESVAWSLLLTAVSVPAFFLLKRKRGV